MVATLLLIRWIAIALSLAALSMPNLRAQQPPESSSRPVEIPAASEGVAAYKRMSIEELMNLDVTSVAKQPEPLKDAAAAIVVITQDDIRRSGASSLPEALRLADNLEVAQSSSSTWSISARGFN